MLRVLIVDDSWLARRFLKSMIERNGYEILEASGGREALDIASRELPSCILLDILMPEMTGLEVLESMQKKRLDIPVIAITADIRRSSRNRYLELGAFEVFNKPPGKDELLSAIQKAIRSKQESV
jgi:CheY-like chemotaxis protein